MKIGISVSGLRFEEVVRITKYLNRYNERNRYNEHYINVRVISSFVLTRYEILFYASYIYAFNTYI